MAYNPLVPGNYDVIAEADFVTPPADKDPIQRSNENANWLWSEHAPPLVAGVYTVDDNKDVPTEFDIGVEDMVSADTIVYRFRHVVRARVGSPDDNISIKVEEYVGAGYSTIHDTGFTVAATDNTTVIYTHDDPINPLAEHLRITYDRDLGAAFMPDSILIYPNDGAVTGGKKPSGVWPFDDGAIATAGAPLHVEHHNRPKRNAHAVLADRAHCAQSFIQENANGTVKWKPSDGGVADGQWARMGHAVASFPGQDGLTLRCRVIATVSAGGSGDRVALAQADTGGKVVAFDADGLVQKVDLAIACEAPGTLMARATMQMAARNTAGNTINVHSVMAYWKPGE